jgi:hypothetical protein
MTWAARRAVRVCARIRRPRPMAQVASAIELLRWLSMAATRELAGRVISFDRSRARGIVDLGGRAVVVDASIVDASHLVPGDAVAVEVASRDRVVSVRVVAAAREEPATSTRGLFGALLDAQPHAPESIVAALALCDDVANHVRAWLERWDRPIRFWEPGNVSEVVDRRPHDAALTEVLSTALHPAAPLERQQWVQARLRLRGVM